MFKVDYLIPIPYETRNLGLPSFVLSETFCQNSDENELRNNIENKVKELNNLFIQVRLPKDNLSIVPISKTCGFYFVESTLVPQSNLRKNSKLREFIFDKSTCIPTRYKLEELNLCYLDTNDAKTSSKIKEIAEESFSDDRFHIDPNCPDSIANKRFANWVSDLYTDKSVIFYYLKYKDDAIAFMCHKNQDLILAGFSQKYRNSGLGEFLWLSVLEKMLSEGIYQAKTLISVNNISVLNLYSRLGFKFNNPSVTLHYWHINSSF
ncbi:MAG TPA: hypothetical protein DEP38_06410 [Cyanobacteria bacterium UBA9226]|nr:hypothetical protein [Cyanobacteria bacterium UBA9226]